MDCTSAAAGVFFNRSQMIEIYAAIDDAPFTVLATSAAVSNATLSMAAMSVGSESSARGWSLKGEQYNNTGDIGYTKKGVADIQFSNLETTNVQGYFGVIYKTSGHSVGVSSEGTQTDTGTSSLTLSGGSSERIYIGGEGNSAGYRGLLGPYIFCFDKAFPEDKILAFAQNPDAYVRNRLLEMVPTWVVTAGSASGSAAGTLQSVTGSSSGVLKYTGAGEGTLSAVTGSSSGFVGISGSAAGTLQAATGSSSGIVWVMGTGEGTLSAVTGSSVGEVPVIGNGAGTLQSATGSSYGILKYTATAAGTLQAVTGDSDGIFTTGQYGTGAGTLSAVTGSASGSVKTTGTGAGTLQVVTGSSSGWIEIIGDGAGTLMSITGFAYITRPSSGLQATVSHLYRDLLDPLLGDVYDKQRQV